METENTFTATDYNQSIRQMNVYFAERNSECQQIIDELRKIESFFEDFGLLTLGRDFVTRPLDQNIAPFSLSSITKSLGLTMGSVIACCESVCIADANTLLRKYRDDLFFYLYVSIYSHTDLETAKSMAPQIAKWINNNLTNFQISQILKTIATDPQLKGTVSKYHLKESFRKIGDYLNNYVHGNGCAYYNRNAASYTQIELTDELRALEYNARYMTVVFLFLLVLCSPVLVMAEDYIDCMDMNTSPPESSQYWVAPFVDEFMKENISLIDENCLNYLRDNTMMQF